MTNDAETDARDDRIYRMRLVGASPRTIAAQFGITIADVHRVVDERMPKVTNEYRARAFALDLERLEQLTARCIDHMAQGSIAAGHLLLKVCERRSQMLGTDAPLRIDPIQLTEIAGPHETSTEELRRLFDELRGKRPPPSLPN